MHQPIATPADLEPVSLDALGKVSLQNRIDQKFLLPEDRLGQLLAMIRGDYYILAIGDRCLFRYHTVYFDSPDFRCYHDHHNGAASRIKIRMREYEDSGACYFEVKEKQKDIRTDKTRMHISSLQHSVDPSMLSTSHYQRLGGQQPEYKLSNRFLRITLCNKQFTERLTIDRDIRLFNNHQAIQLPHVTVAELKQHHADNSSPALQAMKQLHLQETAFSKYSIGATLLYPQLKHNIFKETILKLEALTCSPLTN